jgi:hypothetical protein
MEYKLWCAVRNNDTVTINKIIESDEDVDFNSCYYNLTNWSIFHLACIKGNIPLLKTLLSKPDVDVNSRDHESSTPFSSAVFNNNESVVELLLKDQRVDINEQDGKMRSPFWWAAYSGYDRIIKMMIGCGRDFNTETKGDHYGTKLSSLEIAIKNGNDSAVNLIRLFNEHPERARMQALGWTPASLFASVVFVCDGHLRIKPATDDDNKVKRFFKVVTQLPMELQMIVCQRACFFARDTIVSKDSEQGFRTITKMFEEQ